MKMSLVMEDIVYSRTFRGYISVTEKIITTRHLYCFTHLVPSTLNLHASICNLFDDEPT